MFCGVNEVWKKRLLSYLGPKISSDSKNWKLKINYFLKDKPKSKYIFMTCYLKSSVGTNGLGEVFGTEYYQNIVSLILQAFWEQEFSFSALCRDSRGNTSCWAERTRLLKTGLNTRHSGRPAERHSERCKPLALQTTAAGIPLWPQLCWMPSALMYQPTPCPHQLPLALGDAEPLPFRPSIIKRWNWLIVISSVFPNTN